MKLDPEIRRNRETAKVTFILWAAMLTLPLFLGLTIFSAAFWSGVWHYLDLFLRS